MRRHSHCASKQIRVHAVGLAERAQSRELFLELLIGEGDLILLRLAGGGLRLFAAELRGQIAEAGGVARGCGAIRGRWRRESNAVFAAPMLCCVMADCCCGV